MLVRWATEAECASAIGRREREGFLPSPQVGQALERLAVSRTSGTSCNRRSALAASPDACSGSIRSGQAMLFSLRPRCWGGGRSEIARDGDARRALVRGSEQGGLRDAPGARRAEQSQLRTHVRRRGSSAWRVSRTSDCRSDASACLPEPLRLQRRGGGSNRHRLRRESPGRAGFSPSS